VKLQNISLLAAVAAGVFGLATVGCGDDSAATTSGAGGGGGDDTSTGAGAGDIELKSPPTRPDGAPPGDGPGATVGVSRLYLGEATRAGAKTPTAWEEFGYDLDGQATVDIDGDDKITGADLEGRHCSPVGGEVNAGNLGDGANGVDNSFGKNILTFIAPLLDGDLSGTASEAIAEGSFTLALKMDTLGTGPNYDPIPTGLFAAIGGDDDEDGVAEPGEEWELVPELLNGGDPNDPKIFFPDAFVTENLWVSGEPQTITLQLSLGGVDLSLDINKAVIVVLLNADRTGGTEGLIAGVLDTEAFITEVGEVAAVLAGDAPGLCPGDELFESVVQNVRAASDIMADGSQQPGVNCSGISIGIGFDAQTVTLGDVAEPADPQPSNCD
jgi:hypothetical protein